jgi:outer membrane protein TolC
VARIAGRCSLALVVLCSGCVSKDEPLKYPFHDAQVEYYKDVAQEIAYPIISPPTADPVAFSQAPRTIKSRDLSEVWDMPLMEAVHIALQNNDVIRSAGTFLSPGNPILANGNNAPSVYDPAINESGVLFGNRGVAAALAAFDANFTTSMVWGRNEVVQNNPFFGGGLNPGSALITETGNFFAGLEKDFAYGGQLRLDHTVDYLGSNVPGQLFPSTYTGLVRALYRQPLWAGAGTEYTRIAGPITQSFGGLSGVTQGVVIARINNDISIADFEASIRDLVRDVQETYWDLYLAYRNYDTVVVARNSALKTWQNQKVRIDIGAGIENPADFSQAEDQYFAAQALVENTRSNIFTTETRLRRLLGLPVNEGRVIRPVEEPITAELIPDWQASLTDALVHRVELRKQKWQIKSLDLQLIAANSLTQPRLDFVGGYQVNGFGDHLIGYDDTDTAGTPAGLNNYYETITQGDHTGWQLGFEFNMPIGFRSAHAQVRNIELRLAKAHQVLYAQELEIAHELAAAFQELARAYETARSQYSRRNAAIENERVFQERERGGAGLVDETLRSQERRAQAEVDFFTALVDYNQALINFEYRKGTLLADTNVALRENGWDPEAYIDAYRLAQARTAAIDAPHKHTEPAEFASPVPVGTVQFAQPIEPIPQAAQPDMQPQVQPEMTPEAAEPTAPEEPFELLPEQQQEVQPRLLPSTEAPGTTWNRSASQRHVSRLGRAGAAESAATQLRLPPAQLISRTAPLWDATAASASQAAVETAQAVPQTAATDAGKLAQSRSAAARPPASALDPDVRLPADPQPHAGDLEQPPVSQIGFWRAAK